MVAVRTGPGEPFFSTVYRFPPADARRGADTEDHLIPHAPVSWGELIDKITILEIKCARLASPGAVANAAKELALLRAIAEPVLAQTKTLTVRLKALNEALWEIEDKIRDKEAAREFDADFVAWRARSTRQ